MGDDETERLDAGGIVLQNNPLRIALVLQLWPHPTLPPGVG
ncbi:hypothetical protein [Pseudoxanthomonas spadix]|nr:hypothetical protein [Pseudoxanthomonas spadix]